MAKFTIATNERFKDKDGKWQDRTEWHNLTSWPRTGGNCRGISEKRRKVYIEGSLRTHSWDDKQTGQKKYMTEINVNDLVMLGGKGEGGGGGSGGEYASSRGASGGNNFDQRTPEHEPAPAGPITDEDIPF